jgi:hypothetical protein
MNAPLSRSWRNAYAKKASENPLKLGLLPKPLLGSSLDPLRNLFFGSVQYLMASLIITRSLITEDLLPMSTTCYMAHCETPFAEN